MQHARKALLVITTSLLCMFALSGAAVAGPAGGIKGDPQPEITPFKIGAATGAGSVALEPNGGIVTAWDIGGGHGRVRVCLLARGGHKCTSSVILNPLSGDATFGPAEVFVPFANHVEVVQNTCCDTNPNGSTLVYSSTDGGHTFAAPVRVGKVGVSGAALIHANIVFGVSGQYQSIPAVGASGPPGSIATLGTTDVVDTYVGSYHSGVLAGYDVLGSTWRVHASYAKAGSNFNVTSSYKAVANFNNEQLIGQSGNALLTQQTKGSKAELLLRLFNGSGFGAAHVVPHTSGGGPEWFGIVQDPKGETHVFSESTHSSKLYHLIEESTSNGIRWSSPADLGNAIHSNSFSGALDSRGSGLILGTGGAQSWGYPVLETQRVTFSLKASTIRKGKSTIGSGKGSPAGNGRKVELQVERSGRWYTVKITHESSSGAFSFTIKGSSVGKFRYRAVTNDLAGYLQFGYSSARSLKVTS